MGASTLTFTLSEDHSYFSYEDDSDPDNVETYTMTNRE